MLFSRSLFIGVDPTGGPRAIAYAALDEGLHPIALGQGNVEEALAFLGGQQEAVLALNGPPRPNRGLHQGANHSLPSSAWEDARLAEVELARRGLPIYRTPGDERSAKAWMRAAFHLHKRLAQLGYRSLPAEDGKLWVLEAVAEACYSLWLERLPFPARTLEGRLQRQLALYDLELDIPDPMSFFFEEITRHRILKGELPLDGLYSAGELSALALAYTAWLAAQRPEEISWVGDKEEGQIVLPAKELKEKYS